jgi:hypothetical protein
MEYNFSGISVSAIEKVDKQLGKIRDSVLDDIANFIHLLNDQAVIQKHGELRVEIGDLFADEIKKTVISFTGCMNKVQHALAKYL